MPIQKIKAMFPITSLFLTVLAGGGLVAGCGNSQTPDVTNPQRDTVVTSVGSRPGWDVEDMVKRADAVIIGTFTDDLGAKQEPGSGDPPYIYYDYKDYKLTVEDALYPKGDFPNELAVLVRTGISAPNAKVLQPEDVPAFAQKEKMLLFLENLADPKFAEGPGRPVPKGFTEKTYYRAIIGGFYGKLLQDGDKWEDSRSGKTVTVDQIRAAVQQHKSGSQ